MTGRQAGGRAGSLPTHLHVGVARGDCLFVVLCHSILLSHLQRELELHLRNKREMQQWGTRQCNSVSRSKSELAICSAISS